MIMFEQCPHLPVVFPVINETSSVHPREGALAVPSFQLPNPNIRIPVPEWDSFPETGFRAPSSGSFNSENVMVMSMQRLKNEMTEKS